jgi:hypothetical protein
LEEQMRARGLAALTVSLFALTACNPFRSKPAVEIKTGEVASSSRWNAALATPSELAGALQVKGTAWMAPGKSGGTTRVYVAIANAAPGGVHPWYVHRGQCGNDRGVWGPADAYRPLKVDADGRAAADITLPLEPPTTGDYFVSVHASAQNMGTIVACGNLAPPVK